jgi:hypothetical protein
MATLTQSEFNLAKLRSSQEDQKRIYAALEADGSLEIIDDPEPPEPEPLLDAEGNPVEDAEGNPVLQAPEPVASGEAVQIEVDNVPEEEAEEAEEE